MKKINLIISSVSLDYGGIEKSLLNLLNNLDLNLFNITLVLENKKGIFLDKINKNIKVLEYHPSSNKIKNLLKRIKWLLKNHNKYDVSICYATYSLPANFIARVSAKKRLFFIHSNYYEAFNHNVDKFKSFYDARFLNCYNKLIFVSTNANDDFNNIYPEYRDNTIVINNIVNIDEIVNGSKEKADIKLKNKIVGVFIGRLEEDSKRLSLIVKLASDCQNSGDDIGFLLVGDGPDREKIEKDIENKNLKNIELVGSKSNPYKYLSKGNFLLLTSRYEGYPVVYNEAITLEKPILTTLDIKDDLISIPKNFGIVSETNDLYQNVKKIINFKNKKIDFNEVNKKRITKIQNLIKDLYEEK